MKLDNPEEPIHVLKGDVKVLNIIEDIVSSEDQENSFYVCDVNDIIQKYKMWKAAMPRIKPHYAVKCNDHPIVLRVLASLGLGFDCASKTEIDKVLALGVNPERIIYAHTTKPPSHIRHAAETEVNLMTFDNEMELHKIKNIFPTAKTVIRIKYDAKTAYAHLGLKFGCNPNTEAPYLLKVARSLGINVVGVSFHVGSGCQDISAFHGAIAAARYVFDVAATIGYDFRLLDIGGGFPGECDDSINKYAKVINGAINEYFSDKSVRIISEPGTYFVDSAFTLACNVHSAKKVITENPVTGESSTKYMYYLNDGVFGSLSAAISYQIYKLPQPLREYPNSKKYPSIVWGPTCDSMDQVYGEIMLPEMNLGDWVIFKNMGAYTLTLVTPFNGFEPASVYGVISNSNWLQLRNKVPFTEDNFVGEHEEYLNKDDIKITKEQHYEFPENSFVRG